MGSLALICSALVATVAFAVLNEGTYAEATVVVSKGVGADFHGTQEDENERNLDYHDKHKREALSKQRAPVVCFVRYGGFGKSGAMRFSVDGIPVKKCTHVVFSYLETNNYTGDFLYRKTGTLSLREMKKDVASLKQRNKNIKVLYSYGGGAHVNSMLNRLRNRNAQAKLIDTIDSLVKPDIFDGVNLHLEGPGPSICNKEHFDRILTFIKKFRFKIMHVDDLLTVQLPACRPKCDAVLKSKLARYVDYLFLMTFDYKLDDTTKTKLTSGLILCEGKQINDVGTMPCLKHWVDAGVPRYKMVPGVATYSRTFTLRDPNSNGVGADLHKKGPLGKPGNFTKTEGYMNYVEACRKLNYYKWTRKWVNSAGMAYLHQGDQWISYEDGNSAEEKANWFRSQGMGGVFVWSLDTDDYSGDCVGELFPLATSVFRALEGYRPITDSLREDGSGIDVRLITGETEGKVTQPLVCFMRGEAFERVGARQFSLNTLPLSMCNHLIYSYIETDNKTGSLIFRRRGSTGEKNILRSMGMLKHDTSATEVRTLVSYGGGAHLQSLLKRVRDHQNMVRFFHEIKRWLVTFGLDGINFHLEGPGPPLCKRSDIEAVGNFFKHFRRFLGWDYIITLQLPACRDLKCDLRAYKTMSSDLNYVFLMTFDYKLDDLSKTKLTSGLYNYEGDARTNIESESCLGRWINAGVPKSKMIPGIATYGHSFTLRDPAHNGVSAKLDQKHPLGYGANFTRTDGYMNYVETCRRVNYFRWQRHWVKYAATPYIYYKNQWVSYDDKDSVKVKVEWFLKHWFGGIFVWSLDADDYGGDCVGEIYPMVNSTWKAMSTYRLKQMHRAMEWGRRRSMNQTCEG
uniref:Chitinase n=1 Tax=Rhipicephalus zambeziensis TaxID=60191 RepID=A0A224YVL7_9ACAR